MRECDVCSARLKLVEAAYCWFHRGQLSYPVEKIDDPFHERPVTHMCARCREWAEEYRRTCRRPSGRPRLEEPTSSEARRLAPSPPSTGRIGSETRP
jgi:hypothetical protein